LLEQAASSAALDKTARSQRRLMEMVIKQSP
jgi:hypothetical protein